MVTVFSIQFIYRHSLQGNLIFPELEIKKKKSCNIQVSQNKENNTVCSQLDITHNYLIFSKCQGGGATQIESQTNMCFVRKGKTNLTIFIQCHILRHFLKILRINHEKNLSMSGSPTRYTEVQSSSLSFSLVQKLAKRCRNRQSQQCLGINLFLTNPHHL